MSLGAEAPKGATNVEPSGDSSLPSAAAAASAAATASPAAAASAGSADRRLYVGGVGYDVSWMALKDHFSQAGDVVYCEAKTDGSGLHRGFAIVEFSSSADAARAIDLFDETTFHGRTIYVRLDKRDPYRTASAAQDNGTAPPSSAPPPPKPPPPPPGCGVFVGNLEHAVSAAELEELCDDLHLDVVRTIELPRNSNRSFVLVFGSAKVARKAIYQLDERRWCGRPMRAREFFERGYSPQQVARGEVLSSGRERGRPADARDSKRARR
mmetsp:Transcript_3696/g.10820  ORF Transcript_3696/g.10820 Transcript_3696/m.10820 type:complete len:268 (+) Transcript_3696:709-1512(+)